MFLATCLFGITFITLENTAPNSVSFAQNILDAAHSQATPGKIIAISLTANTFCCLLHAISRRWGIILNNVFGVTKLFILVFIVIIGLVWINHDVASSNFDTKTSFSFENSPNLPFPYAVAFLNALYPYGLFHQINYVRSPIMIILQFLVRLLTILGYLRTRSTTESISSSFLLWGSYDSYSLHGSQYHLGN